MKLTTLTLCTTLATLTAAAPQYGPQYNPQYGPDPWSGFFSADSLYRPYGSPYSDLPYPGPYSIPYEDPGAPYPPQPPAPSPPTPGPFDEPLLPISPPGSTPLLRAEAPIPRPRPVSEKPRDRTPLADRFSPEIEDRLIPPPLPLQQQQQQQPKRVVVQDDVAGPVDMDAVRYHVNVGGIQKGAGGGKTNFHVYSDENGNKRFSDEMDEDTERFITESMIPRLGGKKRGGNRGGVWSVFGDK